MKLHYVTYGKTAAPPLLILHGLLGSERNWHTVGRRLSDEFFLIIPDQRNHGVSPHDYDHSIAALREDLEMLVSSLGLRDFFLLGHSMGGHAAMSYAFIHPEHIKALIIEDIAPRSYDTGLVGILTAMKEIPLDKFQAKKDVERALESGIANPEVRNFIVTNLVRHQDRLSWRVNLDALRDFAANEIRRFKIDPSMQYKGPALFIGGGKSQYRLSDDRELITTHFPKAQLAMVKNAGHWTHHEAVDTFCALVRSFLHPLK